MEGKRPCFQIAVSRSLARRLCAARIRRVFTKQDNGVSVSSFYLSREDKNLDHSILKLSLRAFIMNQ